jgi:putative ABC transport system permease protein
MRTCCRRRWRPGPSSESPRRIWPPGSRRSTVDRRFTEDYFEDTYRTYGAIAATLSTMTVVALTIALMGLFGMAVFIARRRNHEIGVRKTLGANVGQILSLLLRDFSKPVVVANVIAWPLAYVAAQVYLSLFIQRVELSLLPFVSSLAITVLIGWLAVGGQAWRAARVKPATVLRYE